jgi:hypothetical protein
MVRLQAPVADPSEETLVGWQQALDRAEKDGFKPLTSVGSLPDGARVELSSREWTARFLRPAFDPWQTRSKVERTVHEGTVDTPDVLRHRFVVTLREAPDKPPVEYAVTVTETTHTLRADVEQKGLDLASLGEDARAAAIGALADRVVPMSGSYPGAMGESRPYAWVFKHGPLVEGARFSTNPGAEVILMKSWADRFDGGIQGGHVYFVGFKRITGTGRIVILDSSHWFDGKCWAPFEPARP